MTCIQLQFVCLVTGGKSDVVERDGGVRDHARPWRGLRARHLRRSDRLLGRRHQQVPVDGAHCWGWAPQGHQGEDTYGLICAFWREQSKRFRWLKPCHIEPSQPVCCRRFCPHTPKTEKLFHIHFAQLFLTVRDTQNAEKNPSFQLRFVTTWKITVYVKSKMRPFVRFRDLYKFGSDKDPAWQNQQLSNPCASYRVAFVFTYKGAKSIFTSIATLCDERDAQDTELTVFFVELQESDYFTPQGEFRVDSAGSPTLLNCLMYKLSYYRFGDLQVSPQVLLVLPASLTTTTPSAQLHCVNRTNFIFF